MNNMFRKSRDKIKPSEAAQSRMLKNILNSNRKSKTTCGQISAIIAACFCLALIIAVPLWNNINRTRGEISQVLLAVSSEKKSGDSIQFAQVGRKSDGSTTADYWAYMTEDELINNPNNVATVEGVVVDAYNMEIIMPSKEHPKGKDIMYFGIARIKVENIIYGEITTGNVVNSVGGEIRIMLPGPLADTSPNVGIVAETDVTSQLTEGQTGIFIISNLDDRYAKREIDGEIFYYRDIADYAMGEREVFVDTGDSLLFERWCYPTISNAVYLNEVKAFILWKVGIGAEPQIYDDNRFQLNPLDSEDALAITYEQALEAAKKYAGITDNSTLRGVNPYMWTYGAEVFGEEALKANSELAAVGYPKDLPVYVVDFFVENQQSAALDRTAKNLYIIVDAKTGIVLMSYTGTSMYMR